VKKTKVLVSLVTFNDESFLKGCLDSLKEQTVPLNVMIHDNASTDKTVEIIRNAGFEKRVSPRNIGYSGGHNLNLRTNGYDYALLLNADVKLASNYLEILLDSIRFFPQVGLVGGKMLRMDSDGNASCQGTFPVIDSTGIYFTPSLRHFDRGSGELDNGQFDIPQYVFGITGAALLCRYSFIQDLTLRTGEFLDEEFFAYREDAELAWRAQITGWKALYVPTAVAHHHRRGAPTLRRNIQPSINYHSLKNRYLMRMKNMGPAVKRRCFPYAWIRDLGIVFYVLLFEWNSLPALFYAWRLRHCFQKKKMKVESSRLIKDSDIANWFAFIPQAQDLSPGVLNKVAET
jgi:GT2 family glycosyltransferase